MILLLSLLYSQHATANDEHKTGWDAEAFSEPLLMERIMDVLNVAVLNVACICARAVNATATTQEQQRHIEEPPSCHATRAKL